MSYKLQATRNYDLFEMCSFNRDVKRTKELRESMKQHGYIPAYPLHVVRNGGGKLKIKAGHHRFSVARELGLQVFYIISDDTASIPELEVPTGMWSKMDFLTSYVRCGSAPYIAVKEYMDRTGISLQHCVSMLGGQTAGSNNFAKPFRNGTFKVGDTKHAEDVAFIVNEVFQVAPKIARNALFRSSHFALPSGIAVRHEYVYSSLQGQCFHAHEAGDSQGLHESCRERLQPSGTKQSAVGVFG